ncbi:MAG: betaine/proline/choline family ABC transporter ATP-binding protein [Chloroflexota bacterium]
MSSRELLPDGESCLTVSGLWKIYGRKATEIITSPESCRDIEALRAQTGSVVALCDVSFQVKRGETFVILGLSGSGKSTLLRLLIRLQEPTAGRILLLGQDILEFDERKLRALRRNVVSAVLPDFGLFPHRSVRDNVAYVLKIRGVKKPQRYARAKEVIELTGLEGWEDCYPGVLGGGMPQRVALARALAPDPEILLLDEPFRYLEPVLRRQMQDEFLNLQEEVRKTIIFATSDLNEALKLGDRIAVIKEGAIIQIGTPEEVITAPGDRYVRAFIQDASPTRVITARTIMEPPRVLLYEWQGTKVAMHLLRTGYRDEAFLVSRVGKLLGMVTVKGLIQLFRDKETSLKKALEPDFLTATADTVVEDLLPLAASTIYPIAVIDEKGKFLGEIYTNTLLLSMIPEEGGDTEKTKAGETMTDA